MRSPWHRNEEELFEETLDYLLILDGPPCTDATYLATQEGQRHFNGVKNCLQKHRQIARRSAINALLQLHWPRDVEKYGRLERAGKWFHQSFHLYQHPTRPLAVRPEITAWERSPYTLPEIAHILQQERDRQEYDWQSGQGMHRPFPACVETYGHNQQKPHPLLERAQESHCCAGAPLPEKMSTARGRQKVAKDAETREPRQPEQHMTARQRGMSIEQADDLVKDVQRQSGRACLKIRSCKIEETPDRAILLVQMGGERCLVVIQHAGQWEQYWQWYQREMHDKQVVKGELAGQRER